jgi:hypothetical protein
MSKPSNHITITVTPSYAYAFAQIVPKTLIPPIATRCAVVPGSTVQSLMKTRIVLTTFRSLTAEDIISALSPALEGR